MGPHASCAVGVSSVQDAGSLQDLWGPVGSHHKPQTQSLPQPPGLGVLRRALPDPERNKNTGRLGETQRTPAQ